MEASAFCPTCQRQVLSRRADPNHVLHFLIAFFTCGLWLIVWLVIMGTTNKEPFLCTVCGTPIPPAAAAWERPENQAMLARSTASRTKGPLILLVVAVVLAAGGAVAMKVLAPSSKPVIVNYGPKPTACAGEASAPCAVLSFLKTSLYDTKKLAVTCEDPRLDGGPGWVTKCTYTAAGGAPAARVFRLRNGSVVASE